MAIDNFVTGGSKDLLRAALQRERRRLQERIEKRELVEAREAGRKAKAAGATTSTAGTPEEPEDHVPPQEQQENTATTQGAPEGTTKSWSSLKASRFGGSSLRSDLGLGEK